MRKNLILLLLFWFALTYAQARAGSGNPPLGARAAALSGAAVTLSEVWAISHNAAGIAELKHPTFGAYFENRFSISAFNTAAFAVAIPTKKQVTFGADAYRFGDDLFSNQRVGLAAAHKIGFVSLGLKASVLQTRIAELGSHRAFIVDFGGQAQLLKQLVFGGHVYNITQARLAEFADERIPTVLKAGLSYRPSERLMLNLETQKHMEYDADFRAGAEYVFQEVLALRVGFSSLTRSVTGGAGVKFRRFQADYALGNQTALGFSNHLSVTYAFE